MRPDHKLDELLSAYLDGELTDEERAEVDAYLDRSAAAREELAGLDRARSLVRGLPAVDPPFGFYERAILDERRAARAGGDGARRNAPRWPGLAAAGAAAAALVLVVGVTPVGDRVAPPVAAFAERHDEMASEAPTGTAVPPATAVTTTATPPPTTADAGGFDPMPMAEADAMGGPYAIPAALDDYQRVAVYRADAGTVHVVYRHGAAMVSVYEQVGTVDWTSLPDGDRMTVGDDPAWASKTAPGAGRGRTGAASVLVVERPPLVYTVVASMGHDEMVTMATSLPEPGSMGLTDRAREACADIVSRFGFSG